MSRTLLETLNRAVQAYPDEPAIVLDDRSLTYSGLDTASDAIAGFLAEKGVTRGDRVGIHAAKSLDAIAGVYGILKTGAAYVPINPGAPPAYVAEVVADCDITAMIADTARLGNAMLAGVGTVIGPDSPQHDVASWDQIRRADMRPPTPDVGSRDLAYVLYTSGTTGRPKGIAHTHDSAAAFAEAVVATYGITKDDRLTSHAPLHFDLSTFDLFGALTAGASTVLVPEAVTRFPASLAALLEEQAISVTYAVPFAFVQLLLRGALELRDLTRLRWIVFAGEVFPTKHLRELMRLLPDTRFSNIYGPTETNGVTYHHVDSIDDDDDSPIPIGVTFPGMHAIVVDHDDREVPDGETGELLVHSPTRMEGYWGQAALSSSATSTRVFGGSELHYHRTGDLARRNDAGDLELVGRRDRQIKSRGHRVELDEVEAVLAAHPDVEEAVVYTVPDGAGSLEIRAIVRPGSSASDPAERAAELRRHVGETLPGYAIPTRIETVTSVPRTSTGKIDRAGLVAGIPGKGVIDG